MKTAVLYTRVSTDEQANKGYSLKHQIECLKNYCDHHKIEVLHHFVDDYSAKTFNRPEWINLEKFCRSNKNKIDAVLFTKWDRFSRNIEASLTTIRKFKEIGVKLNSIEQPLDLDIPDNKIILGVYLSIPEVENDKIGIRTKEGSRKAIKEGCFIYRAPFGYNPTRINNNATLEPDEYKSTVVQSIFKEFASGNYTQDELRKSINKKYRQSISRSNFNELLRKRVYIGMIKVPAFGDESEYYIEGIHPALVESDIFNQVQNILDGKRNKPKTYKSGNIAFPLRGHLICSGCGKLLTSSFSQGRNKKFGYYHCHAPCKVRYNKDKAHKAFESYLKSITIDKDLIGIFESILKATLKKKYSTVNKDIKLFQNEIDSLRSKIDKAEEQLFEGQLPADVFNNVKTRYEVIISDNQEKIKTSKNYKLDADQLLEKCMLLLSDLPSFYEKQDIKGKNNLIGSIFPNKIEFDGITMSNPAPITIFELIKASGINGGGNTGNKKTGHQSKEKDIRLGTLGRNSIFLQPVQILLNLPKSKYTYKVEPN